MIRVCRKEFKLLVRTYMLIYGDMINVKYVLAYHKSVLNQSVKGRRCRLLNTAH